MKKHELLRSGDSIIRVLEIRDKVLIIDCIKRTMPVWVEPDALDSYSNCSIEALREVCSFHENIALMLALINDAEHVFIYRNTADLNGVRPF